MEFLEPKKNPSGILKFTPYAFAKIMFMRDAGDTEIGGYGISGTEDPMLVTDFCLVKQKCTSVSVDLDEEDSIKFVEDMLDKGIAPWQCQRIWIHTHPGNCPNPSGADEDNFDTNFSLPDCAIFYILANEGKDYTRMRFNVAPGIDCEIKSEVDYSHPFDASNQAEWKKEYEDKVTKEDVKFYKGEKESITEFLRNNKQYFHRDTTSTIPNLEEEEKDENPFIFEEGDCILFYVEEEKDYYKYDKELERFYAPDGRRIRNPKLEWEALIENFIEHSEEEEWKEAFRDMEGQYESIIGGQIG